MDKDVIDQVIETARRRLNKKRKKWQYIIDHFCDPFPEDRTSLEYAQFLKDRLKGAKFSTKGLDRAYEGILEIEIAHREINDLCFMLGRVRGLK